MNRIIEDRLLIDDCEKGILVLRDILKGAGLKIGTNTANDLLCRISKHREKFTKRVLDKEAYIKKNKDLFDAIFKNDARNIGGSYFEKKSDEIYIKAIEAEKKIFDELVSDGFYSAKTARVDAMRSLMKTYTKIFPK